MVTTRAQSAVWTEIRHVTEMVEEVKAQLNVLEGYAERAEARALSRDKVLTMLLAQNRALNERNLFLLQAAGLKAAIDNQNGAGVVVWPTK